MRLVPITLSDHQEAVLLGLVPADSMAAAVLERHDLAVMVKTPSGVIRAVKTDEGIKFAAKARIRRMAEVYR